MVKRAISSLYVLNCFKYFLMYIFLQSVPKIRQEKFWTISSICAKLYTADALKELLSKNWLNLFFLLFWHTNIPPRYSSTSNA